MPLKPHISPKILTNIATGYNNPNKIFMEYIDNSIDSAEEYFDSMNNSYSKQITISLELLGNDDKTGKIEIRDNCTGIDNIEKIVTQIANSDKKSSTFTNGQFGYGVYSFLATCKTLEVISKFKNSDVAYYISIKKEQIDVDSFEEVVFPDPVEKSFTEESGTLITLKDFDKGSWKQVNLDEIKNEVEEHFELLLHRKNLSIELIDENGNKFHCNTYDYSKIEGEEITYETDNLMQTSGRGTYEVFSSFKLSPPIKTYIKITEKKIINKPPLFFIKGRAIGKVSEIFHRSRHKSNLWNHPNITGYVDLAHHIEPTILRTQLKNDSKTRALFQYIEKTLEPNLLELLDLYKESNDSKHYKTLENELNKALAKLAKLDSLNYRTSTVSNGEVQLGVGSEGSSLEEGFGSKDRGDDRKNETDNANEFGQNEGDGFGPSDKPGDLPSDQGVGEAPQMSDDNAYTDSIGSQKRRSGFNIKITDLEPEISEINGVEKLKRSKYVDGSIIIYKKHPDFLDRVDQTSRRGEPRVTPRLITYLAGEITVFYKDILQTRNGQPEYNISLFENLVEFIYQFESMLKDLNGKNLSDISEEDEN